MSVGTAGDKIYWVPWWWLLIAWGVWGAGALAWEGVQHLRELRARQRFVNPSRPAQPEEYRPAFRAISPARPAFTQQGAYGAADTSPRPQGTGFDWFKLLEVVGIMVSIIVGVVQLFGE